MASDSDSKNPADNAEQHPPSRSEVLASNPEQSQVATNTQNKTAEQPTVAQEMRREFRWFEFGSLFINGALAVIGIIALCIYNGQLGVMRGQLREISKQFPELQESANAAKSAAETANATLKQSHDAFKSEQRAYVTPKSVAFDTEPRPGQAIGLSLMLNNSGRTPAWKCTFDTDMEMNGKKLLAISSHETGGVIASQEIAQKHYIIHFAQDVGDLGTGNLTLKGRIEYHDIFKDCHVTTFCAVYEGKKKVFKFCSFGNDLDTQSCQGR